MNNFEKCPLIETADKTASAQKSSPKKPAWNKGISVGKKLGLSSRQVKKAFRHLKSEVKQNKNTSEAKKKRSLRNIAMFALAIESFLRGGDLMRLKVHQVFYSNGDVRSTFVVKQQKTGKNVTCIISSKTAKLLQRWYHHKKPSQQDYLFPGCGSTRHFSTRQYRRLIKSWITAIELPEGRAIFFL